MKNFIKYTVIAIVALSVIGAIIGDDSETSTEPKSSVENIKSEKTEKPKVSEVPKKKAKSTIKPTPKPKKKKIGFYIVYEENIFFSIYDVNVYLDGKKLKTISNGSITGFYKNILQGKHKLTISKEGDKSISTSLNFKVTKSEVFYVNCKAKKKKIIAEILQNERTTDELDKLIKGSQTPKPTKTNQENTSKPKSTPKEMSQEEFINSCESYDYKTVLRNPDDYIGCHIVLECKIRDSYDNIWNDTPYYVCRAWDNEIEDYYGDRYYIYDKRSDNSLKLLNDDLILVYGVICKPQGGNGNVFAINMKYAEVISE